MRTNHADLLRQRSDLELLSFCIWGEARGEPIAGKLAVAHVVLNRVNARSWYGRTIGEVILKPLQFSCFNADNPNLPKILGLSASDPNLTFCSAIAELTISRLTKDPTSGATHYHAAGCRPSWAEKLVFLCRIGDHLFYREHRSRVLRRLSCWMKQLSPRSSLAEVPHSAERMARSAKSEVSGSMRYAFCPMPEQE